VYTQAFEGGGGFLDLSGGEDEAAAAAGPAAASTVPIRYDIRIVAPGTLQVRNNTLRITADADLQLRGTYDRPILLGRVEVQRGEALVFAKRFVFTRGTVDFNNPARIDPFFDVEAETRIRVPGETYRVTVRAAGPRDRLSNLQLTSDPPLPEGDVLALVAGDITPNRNIELGQYTAQYTPQQRLAAEQAARALTGLAGVSEVSRAVEKGLGVDTVQITPSLNDPTGQSNRFEPGARVTIFKRVSDRVSLTYSRSLGSSTRDQIIVLEYDQTDQFSWILSRNEDGTYALDWQIRKTY
jgi:autotransporter translocation and assembly factor TamB